MSGTCLSDLGNCRGLFSAEPDRVVDLQSGRNATLTTLDDCIATPTKSRAVGKLMFPAGYQVIRLAVFAIAANRPPN